MMHSKILYIACEPTLAVNAIAIASAFRSAHPESEQILVDPRRVLWPEYDAPSPSEEFKLSGFEGEVSGHAEFAEVLRYRPDYATMLPYLPNRAQGGPEGQSR